MKVHAVGSVRSSTTRLNITSRGHTYNTTSSRTQAPPGPRPEAGGYNQNHLKFPTESEHWARMASSGDGFQPRAQARKAFAGSATGSTTSNIKYEVAITVFMGAVSPGERKIAHIGVSISKIMTSVLNPLITYHRTALMDLMGSTHISEGKNSIESAMTCWRPSGLLGRKDTRSHLRKQLCGVSMFLLPSLARA